MTRAIDSIKRGTAVEIDGVSRTFSTGVRAVDGLSLNIPAGEFLAIIGPSGCGKSTLLRMIAGLDRPDSGSVTHRFSASVDEDPRSDVVEYQRGTASSIAYVFQDAHLLPWRSVIDNVALPLELSGNSRPIRRAAARDAIASVGLSDAADRYPNQLSGGMRMRVSLARALVTNPSLLLLDEPFAALDEITRQRLDEQLHQLWKERGMTVIFVTHSILEAAFLAERALVFSNRPARVLLDHTLQLPRERNSALRSDPFFASEMRKLYEVLERSEGGAP